VKIQQIHHVSLQVKDLARSCAFYREVLQLESIPRPAFRSQGAWFGLNADQQLHLIGGRTEPVSSAIRGNHFALEVETLEQCTTQLKALGVPFSGPQQRSDGAVQVFLTDPDGHVIELFAPAASPEPAPNPPELG
jgi:catechol 2,3-dioxygenase-like lactoylglutathione lyase family enzyme